MDAELAGRESTLIALDNVCGYSTVFQRGVSPAFILKEASSAPRVIGLNSKAVKGLTRFNTSACERGFAYIDSEVSRAMLNMLYQGTDGGLGYTSHFSTPHSDSLRTSGLGSTENSHGI